MRGRYWLIALPALAACDHGAVFRPTGYGSDAPLNPSSPIRLTYSPGADDTPVWLPDEARILYSLQRLDRPDRDRCLGILPATGGTLERMICNSVPAGDTTRDLFESPAVSPGGRLAYMHTVQRINGFVVLREIVVATLAAPESGQSFSTQFPIATGQAYQAEQIRWLGDSALVYVADGNSGLFPGFTTTDKLGVVRVRLTGGKPTVEMVPGTDFATSLAVDTPDIIYFTVSGPLVFRRVLSTGAMTVAHNFGGLGVPTAIQVVGTLLTAVVNGQLYVVNLFSGTETALPAAGLQLVQLALERSGNRVVAEARSGANTDLWLFRLP